jgi:hypothetical protein
MRVNNVFPLSEEETAFYISLNWFDLAPEAQTQITEKIKQEMGADNVFSFPNMEIRFVARKEHQ